MTKIPISLERPPIVEAVFEIRFSSHQGPIGDLLPGLLFSQMGNRFLTVEELALNNLPREFRAQNPNLQYAPHMKLVGEGESLLIGDQVITACKPQPYRGWDNFWGLCELVIKTISTTNVINEIERFSYKCVNLVEDEHSDPLNSFKISLSLGSFPVQKKGFRIRTEFDVNEFSSIVEVVAGAKVTSSDGTSKTGMLFTIDTYKTTSSDEFWGDPKGLVGAAHEVEKKIFFDLLKSGKVEEYGPVWREE